MASEFSDEAQSAEVQYLTEAAKDPELERRKERRAAKKKRREEEEKNKQWINRPTAQRTPEPAPPDTDLRQFTAAETNAVLTNSANRMVSLSPDDKARVQAGDAVLYKEGNEVFLQETQQSVDMRQGAAVRVYQAELESVAPGDIEGQKTELKRQAELGEGKVRGVGVDYLQITQETYGEAIPLGGLSKSQIFDQADLGGSWGYVASTQYIEEAGFMTSAMIPRWEDLEMEFMPATSAAVSGEAVAQQLGLLVDPSLGEFDINVAPEKTIQVIQEQILQQEYAGPMAAAELRKNVVFGQYLERNYDTQMERHIKAISEYDLYARGTDKMEEEFKSIIPYSRALSGEPGIYAYNPYEEIRGMDAIDWSEYLGEPDPNLSVANFAAAEKVTTRVTSMEQIQTLTVKAQESRMRGPTFDQEMFSAGLSDFWSPADFLMFPALIAIGATNPSGAILKGGKFAADVKKAGGEFKEGLLTDPMQTYKDTMTPRLKGQLVGVALPIGLVGRFGKAGGGAARALAFYVDPLEQVFAEGITPVIKYGGGVTGRRAVQKVGGQLDIEESLIYGTAAGLKYAGGKIGDVAAFAGIKGFESNLATALRKEAYVRGIGAPKRGSVKTGEMPDQFGLDNKVYKTMVDFRAGRKAEKETVKAEIKNAKVLAALETGYAPGAMPRYAGQFSGPSNVIKAMEASSSGFPSGRFDKPLFKDDDKYLGGGLAVLAVMKTHKVGTTVKRQYAEGKAYESTAGPSYQKLQKQMEARTELEMPTPSSFEQAIDIEVEDYNPKMPMLELPAPKVFEPKQFEGMPKRLEMESGFTSMKPQLEGLEQRFEGLESRFDVERAMTKMETPKMKGLEQKFKTDTRLETEIERRGKEFEKRQEVTMKKKLDIEIPTKGPGLPTGEDMMKKMKMPDFNMKEISREFEYKLPKNLDARFNRALGGK